MTEQTKQSEEARPRYRTVEEKKESLRARYRGAVLALEEATGIDARYLENAIAEHTGIIASGAGLQDLGQCVASAERWRELVTGEYGAERLENLKARVDRAQNNLGRYCGAGGTLMSYETAWEDFKDIWFRMLPLRDDRTHRSLWSMLDGIMSHGTAAMVPAAVDKFYREFFGDDNKLARRLAPWSYPNGLPSRRNALYEIETESTVPERYLEVSEFEGSVYLGMADRLEGMGYGGTVRIQVAEGSDKEEALKKLKGMVARLEDGWEEHTDPHYFAEYPGDVDDIGD